MEAKVGQNDPECLFCGSNTTKNTCFEDTIFNEKAFSYLQCKQCGLIYVNPLPTLEDYIKMYPVEYQGDIKTEYSNEYDSLIRKIKKIAPGNKLLDYGCGNGRFIVEAMAHDFEVSGVEFSSDLVQALQNHFPKVQLYEVDTFFEKNQYFDVIFMSNVLEHLRNPKEIIHKLTQCLHQDGIFVLEGPIENNFNLALIFRKLIFGARKFLLNKSVDHAPRHIFYSNKKNQKSFLEHCGLETLDYNVFESSWPFPRNPSQCKTVRQKIMYHIANLSIQLSKSNRNWGNIFLYIGKQK